MEGADGLNWSRGIAISPDGKHLYGAGYQDDSVSWYAIDPIDEGLSFLGMKRRTHGFPSLNGAHTAVVSEDGKNIYSSSHAGFAVNWFDRNTSTGALAFGGFFMNGTDGFGTGLKHAFDLALSKDQRHLYVLGNGDNRINWFERKVTTGLTVCNAFASNPMSLQISSDDRFIHGGRSRICWFERNSTSERLLYLANYEMESTVSTGLTGNKYSPVS